MRVLTQMLCNYHCNSIMHMHDTVNIYTISENRVANFDIFFRKNQNDLIYVVWGKV